MAFHKSVLKQYGKDIFCDAWGYVPQIGDHPRNFDWGRTKHFSRREWNNIIWKCETDTKFALLKLRGKYRTYNRKPRERK